MNILKSKHTLYVGSFSLLAALWSRYELIPQTKLQEVHTAQFTSKISSAERAPASIQNKLELSEDISKENKISLIKKGLHSEPSSGNSSMQGARTNSPSRDIELHQNHQPE